jgi:long-chain acyl-CoA synthetase
MFNSLEKFSNNVAFEDESNTRLHYSDLISFSDIFKEIIPSRSLVFSLCSNNKESMVGYISFIRNEVVPLLIDSSLNTKSLSDLYNKYSPDYIWMPSSRLEIFKNCKIVYSYENYRLVACNNSYMANLNPNLAMLLMTSGSTGSPKLVRLSYKNIKSNAESIANYLSIDNLQRPITSLPMSYSFGLSIINSHIIKGATILLTSRSLMEKSFWSMLKDKKATSLSGVPFTFEMLKKLRFFKMDLPDIRSLTQAGGKLNKETVKEFALYCKVNKKDFYVMYGQTEATARMSYVPPGTIMDKPGSIGIAIPNGEFSIEASDNQSSLDLNTDGELIYSGPNVSLGYASSVADLEKGDENNGTLYTGDIARKDKDGFFYITGRKRRFIKIFGNRINLDEVEQIIKEIYQDVACSGSDDNMSIYLVNKNMVEKVKKHVSNRMGIHFSAFKIYVIDEIPKNISGKILYTELTEE